MDNNENGVKLFQKMARIMGELKRLPKTGFNKHFEYKYATDSDIADTIRELLSKENIAFFAEMVSIEQIGKKSRAQFVFTFACGDTGFTRSCSWFAEADDGQDKGLNKTATAAEKFFLLKTFVMSTGDERDDADSQGEVRDKKAPQKPATQSNGNAAKAFPTAAKAADFKAFWYKRGLSEADIKIALGIELFNAYAGTWEQAMATVEQATGVKA